jgi:hypothetical protein
MGNWMIWTGLDIVVRSQDIVVGFGVCEEMVFRILRQ